MFDHKDTLHKDSACETKDCVSNPVEQIVSKPDEFTVEQENAIFFVVQWLFKKENKHRIIHRNEIFEMIYDELNS